MVGKRLFMMHIAKTAGTTVNTLLETQCDAITHLEGRPGAMPALMSCRP
jgi:hypothetical protein